MYVLDNASKGCSWRLLCCAGPVLRRRLRYALVGVMSRELATDRRGGSLRPHEIGLHGRPQAHGLS